MENLKNVPTVIWYLIALNARLLAGVLFYYYQFDRKIRIYWKRIERVLNWIPIRQFGIRKSGNDAVDWLNRLQFPEEKVNPNEMSLLTNLFEKSDLKNINSVKAVSWNELADLGEIDENENSDSCQGAGLHPAGDTHD